MTASRAARERRAGVQAGPLARVRIDVGRDDQFVYKITCTECVRGEGRWSSYRRGADNGFMAAMDRWILHLSEKHPDSDAPCLAYLPEAQARLHEQRQRDGAVRASGLGSERGHAEPRDPDTRDAAGGGPAQRRR